MLQASPSTQAQRDTYGQICTDRNIGTWKDWNMEPVTGHEVLDWKAHLRITVLYPVERDDIVPMKPRKRGGGIAISHQQYMN
jgi:hypothetical protein